MSRNFKGPTTRPTWVSDSDASACTKCFTFFKTLTRKVSYIALANGSDVVSQINAAQGFSSLTLDGTSQMRMMEQGCLGILICCLNPKNPPSVRYITKAFANLTRNATNRLKMIESSVIEAIAPLLPAEGAETATIDNEVCLHICSTFEGLACLENSQINTRLVTPYLDVIIRLTNSQDTALRTSAAGILHNLIYNECTRDAVVEREGHNALISLILVEEPALQVTAAKALARLAEDEKYQRKLAQSGALMPLLMQLGSSSVEVQEHAAKALANLAENNENQVKICGAGGIKSLYSLLTSKHPGVLLNITKVLANLSSNPASHEGLSDLEMYSALVQVAVSPSIPMLQANAICIICKISHCYPVVERMRENKVLQDALRPFAEDMDGGKIHEYAVQILSSIQASGGYRVSWRASTINAVSPGVHRTQSAFLPKTPTTPRQQPRET